MSQVRFSGLRNWLFPFRLSECKTLFSMGAMIFLILFNYTILRNLKDALIINAPGSDAEVISYLKLWAITPSAIVFIFFYSMLSNSFQRERVFNYCILPFIAFFTLFAFVLYPNVASLHPSQEFTESLSLAYPRLKWFIIIFSNWTYSLFYVFAEMWGSVVLALLFWQFANARICREDAKRFYPFFGFLGNFGLVISGQILGFFSKPSNGYSWSSALFILLFIVLINAFFILLAHSFASKDVNSLDSAQKFSHKKKQKSSLKESIAHIFSSKHLAFIAFIVFAYGICINLLDVLWKGQVKAYYLGDPAAYAAFMGHFSTLTGLVAMPLMLLGGQILRRMSWLNSALIAPLILLLTGLGFFAVLLSGRYLFSQSFFFFGMEYSFLFFAVQIGLWQSIFSKASKYSLFDSTKEMAYMPLDEELKSKGKAAVDVVGGRSGKSGGALLIIALQTLLPGMSLAALSPFIAIVFLLIIIGWLYSLNGLNKSLSQAGQK